MPYYVYILRCKDGHFYYGYTSDLNRRLEQHCQGEVRFTKPRLPVELVQRRSFSLLCEGVSRVEFWGLARLARPPKAAGQGGIFVRAIYRG